MNSSTDTAIIGAGPYGLSISAYLSEAGVPHQVLGQPMYAWRNFMPPGMLMRSEAFASDLYAPQGGYTLEEYCRRNGISYAPIGMRLPLETFVDYGLWFQSQLVSHLRTLDVVELRRQDGFFRLALSDGSSLVARRVIVAQGLKGFDRTPPIFQGLPKPYVIHSGEIGSLAWARNKNIVIVGGGQSALGLAALLNEIGARVRVLVRGEAVSWNAEPDASRSIISRLLKPEGGLAAGWYPYMLSEYPFLFRAIHRQLRKRIAESSFGPSGAWWLHDRVVGKVDLSFRTEVSHAEVKNGQLILQIASRNETSSVTADHLIVATGFGVDMAKHSFFSRELLESLSLVGGWPELTRNFETNVRGLYVIGPAAALSFGPVMRFVYGAKYGAPQLTRHISRCFKEEARDFVFPSDPVEGDSGAALHGQSIFRASGNNLD
ncbi:NAD(P)-binding domain-containing protein [Cupriavidus sp. BIC8F]|uniref:NAD(P)-binding domain-containing protein n=1 Tax=Cupriavidus sp. BIC8F TaxID=3079014 RepID=UPI00291626DB|nr:NAD(P)-binding domain-containing protein [Cupriavidus sp. BIC8F]